METNAVDLQMMKNAISLAEKAAHVDEVPVGAVVYLGNEIVGEGYNLRESSNDPTAHAEIIALRNASEKLGRWRLHDCSIAVTLEPCPMCAGAMVNARIARLIYGATDSKAGACESIYSIPSDVRLNHRIEVTSGIMAEACSAMLTRFFEKKRLYSN